MRKNFFIIAGLFALGLLIFIHSQVSFAASPVVTTNAASATSTEATLNGEVTGDPVNLGGYTKAGFVLGTASVSDDSPGSYNMSSTTIVSAASTTAGSWSHATTSLNKGEVYYYRAWAATTTYGVTSTESGVGYGLEAQFMTGLEEPDDLTATDATQNSIILSWTTTTGAHTVYVEIRHSVDSYPSSITGGALGCQVNGTTCAASDLTCGNTYYFRAWATTTDTVGGMSTSSNTYDQLTVNTTSCTIQPSGGGRTLTAPTTYDDSLVITEGAESTETREVVLTLKASNAQLMTICNDSNLLGCWLEDYNETKSWELTEGEGVKTVYAKFVSSDGMNSETVSDTITLTAPVVEEAVEEEEVVEEEEEEEVIEEEEIVEEEVVEEEVIEEVAEEVTTAESLRAQIQELQLQLIELLRQLIQALQGQLTAVSQFLGALF